MVNINKLKIQNQPLDMNWEVTYDTRRENTKEHKNAM